MVEGSRVRCPMQSSQALVKFSQFCKRRDGVHLFPWAVSIVSASAHAHLLTKFNPLVSDLVPANINRLLFLELPVELSVVLSRSSSSLRSVRDQLEFGDYRIEVVCGSRLNGLETFRVWTWRVRSSRAQNSCTCFDLLLLPWQTIYFTGIIQSFSFSTLCNNSCEASALVINCLNFSLHWIREPLLINRNCVTFPSITLVLLFNRLRF